jgi:hypothetical protein
MRTVFTGIHFVARSGIIAQEITDDLEAALDQFETIADDLK